MLVYQIQETSYSDVLDFQQASGSPGANFYRDKTAANDLSTNDEYVLITAFDHRTEPQNYMYPSV